MKNKRLVLLLLVGTMLFSLCAAAYAKTTEIVVWTFLNPADKSGRGKVLADLIARYKETYPDVNVIVESMQWDTIGAKFLAAHQTGTAPDVIFCLSSYFGEALKVGALEPLDTLFLSRWTDKQVADINDSRFQMGVTKGRHYQVFMFANVSGILYRTDIFKKFGIDPATLTTWDAITKAAQKMTYVNKDGMQVYGLGVGLSESSADSSVLIADTLCRYGSVVDSKGQPVWAESQYSKRALQLQVDMIKRYRIMPASAITSTSDEIYSDFAAGKYAMIFGGSTRFGTIQSQCVFDPADFSIMPYPAEDGYKYTAYVSGWNVGVWSGSKHKTEAGRFIEMMVSPEFDKKWVLEGSQIPLLSSTKDALKDYFSEPRKAFIPKTMVLLKNAVSDDTEHVTTGYRSDLNRAVQYVYADGYSVETALTKTAQEFLASTGQ
jgi:multiple sugar transport system substrate-binding protein